LFERADLFVCEGEHGAKTLSGMGCPERKIMVSHLGVEVGQVSEPRRHRVGPGLRLLQVASFREKKGHLDCVRALALAAERTPGITLTLVGGGDPAMVGKIKAECERLGVSGLVTFLGPVPYGDVPGLFASHDVFIHPSCYAHDLDCEGGAPVVLLDAQKAGMPVISTTHCDIPGVVLDESSGLLAGEHDVKGIASHICRFAEMSDSDFHAFSVNGIAHVVSRFNSATCGLDLVQRYESLVRN
jgi:colanic acid/amylovoran biosynthesis glycosyltransferase